MTKVTVTSIDGKIVIAGIDAPLEIVTATPPPVDAAARKILQYARNRDEIQRVGELLWGDAERPDELSRGYKGRAQSIYGIGGFERPGTAIANVDRDAAIRRAVEMADERGMR
jgi:hypothetical protein